jgi:hypothetical protein
MFLQLQYKSNLPGHDLVTRRPERRRSRASRRRIALVTGVVFCAIVLLLGIAVGVMLFLTRETSTPYRLGQALEQYKVMLRRGNKQVDSPTKDLPAPGVYTYRTTGSESASAPGLLTSGAGYPATTTMTVLAKGCGENWRWQPLTNRYEDLAVCRAPDGNVLLQSRFDAEQFYGVTDSRLFSCTSASVWLPSVTRPGQKLSGTCTNGGNKNSGGMSIDYSGEVVSDSTDVLGGTKIPIEHLVVHETIAGDTVGSGTESLWLDADTGLLIKETRTENTRSQSAVGWVPSTESFTLTLASLTPEQ